MPSQGGNPFHGSREQANQIWEQEQGEVFGIYAGIKKDDISDGPGSMGAAELRPEGDEARLYGEAASAVTSEEAYKRSGVFSNEEIHRAKLVALEGMTENGYFRVTSDEGSPESYIDTKQLELENGTRGKFDSLNSYSKSEQHFQDSGMSPLGAVMNSVNSSRLSQEMGEGYETLVPETVIREHDGEIGKFEKDVPPRTLSRGKDGPTGELKKDFHRAAVFDFVVGHHDRNTFRREEYTADGENRLALTHNEYSFPDSNAYSGLFKEDSLNEREAAKGGLGARLTRADRRSLGRAREAAKDWGGLGSLTHQQADATVERIDYLLEKGRVSSLREFTQAKNREERLL